MKEHFNSSGYVKLILVVLLLVACAFVAISFGKPYFHYYTLGSHTRDILKSEIGNVDVIKEKVMADAKELNIPLDEDNLEVTLDKKVIKVRAKWSETVDFWGYYQKKFDFNMYEEY
jgi:hypothetical protein